EKVNGDVQLQALIDDKKMVVMEAIIRRDLHLDDADGVECLPNADIFEELARIGYEKPPPKLTFYKAFFFTQWNSMASAVIFLATSRKFNFSKYIFNSMVRNVDSPRELEKVSQVLRLLCLTLCWFIHNNKLKQVAELEKDRNSQAMEILQLKKRVKRLERKKKSKTLRLKRLRRVGVDQRVESSSNTVLGAEEDAFKQGGKIAAIDADEGTTLVNAETDEEEVVLDAESQKRTNLKTKVHLVKENVNVASKGVSAVIAPELVSTAEPTLFDDENNSHDEEVQKVTARDEQERADMEKSLVLQRQLDEREDDIDWSAVAEQESFKNLRASEVSRSESTQEIPTDDPKEITKEDVQNMLEIVPVPEFRVEALQICVLTVICKLYEFTQRFVDVFKRARRDGRASGAEVDEPLVDLMIDELAEPIVEVEEQMVALVMDMEEELAMLFGDDDFSDNGLDDEEDDEEVWEMDEEWLMASITPPLMPVMPSSSTYEVEDLCTRMGNLEYGHGQLVKKVITINDAEVADRIVIREIGPSVSTIEGQMQVMASQMVQVMSRLEQVGAHVEQAGCDPKG
nr:hypothetical protein [Tanacetum cinerariifolium]